MFSEALRHSWDGAGWNLQAQYPRGADPCDRHPMGDFKLRSREEVGGGKDYAIIAIADKLGQVCFAGMSGCEVGPRPNRRPPG